MVGIRLSKPRGLSRPRLGSIFTLPLSLSAPSDPRLIVRALIQGKIDARSIVFKRINFDIVAQRDYFTIRLYTVKNSYGL